jgi:hypothetical protein
MVILLKIVSRDILARNMLSNLMAVLPSERICVKICLDRYKYHKQQP